MKGWPFKKLFNIHVKGEKISIQQKMSKIGTFKNKVQNHSKVHSYLLVEVVIVISFNPYLFFHHVSYIESL